MPASVSASPRQTVLVVDDSDANRELVRSILEPEFSVVEAADGVTALALVADASVDLILLDVMMPGLSGFDVSRRLREAHHGEHLPILFLTSLIESADRLAGFEAGADDFISKPINVAELRARVRAFARTRALHRERSDMLAELERLHDLKDDLAALLVHDLRNPLAGISASLELLQYEPLSEGGRESVNAAAEAAARLSTMVDDLLRIRLLEEGARAVAREPRDLEELVASALRTLDPVAEVKRVTLVLEAPGGTIVACDAELVRRAVENLVANAVRHTPRDTRVVARLEREPGEVHVIVEDAGPGIPPEQRPLLFAKYGNHELRTGGRRSGHGLGLYLVSLVMQAHGGTARVDGSSAAGTRVVMTFPLQHETAGVPS